MAQVKRFTGMFERRSSKRLFYLCFFFPRTDAFPGPHSREKPVVGSRPQAHQPAAASFLGMRLRCLNAIFQSAHSLLLIWKIMNECHHPFLSSSPPVFPTRRAWNWSLPT